MLVNVASNEVPALMRVLPNNPDDSYLVRKVEGGPDIVGGRMPLGRAPLSAEQIGMIRSWISAGAMQSSAVATSAKVFGTQVLKTENTRVYELQTSAELDSSTLSEQAVMVYLINGDTKTLANPGDVQVLPMGNKLNVTFSGDTGNADSIELQLNNPSVSSVLDIYGRQLDGNNDGIDGGAYSFVDVL